MAVGTGSYSLVVSGLNLKTYTASNLITGTSYKFRVSATNKVGPGDDSDEVSILAAQIPDKPTTPSTVFIDDDIIISWTAPESRGSPILGYFVTINRFDGTYMQDIANCDGKTFSATGVSFCTVPSTVLNAAPFNLAWGSQVYAKVIAQNAYGNSLESDPGSGARILTKPDAPLFL